MRAGTLTEGLFRAAWPDRPDRFGVSAAGPIGKVRLTKAPPRAPRALLSSEQLRKVSGAICVPQGCNQVQGATASLAFMATLAL